MTERIRGNEILLVPIRQKALISETASIETPAKTTGNLTLRIAATTNAPTTSIHNVLTSLQIAAVTPRQTHLVLTSKTVAISARPNARQNQGIQPLPQQPPLRPRWAPREHEPRLSHPPQPAYHANLDNDVDTHPAAYYTDQQTGDYAAQGEYTGNGQDETADHGYANRAVARRIYPCAG